MNIPVKKFLTCKEAADTLGFCSAHVRRLILQKKIRAEKIGHSWLIKASHLEKVNRKKPKINKE